MRIAQATIPSLLLPQALGLEVSRSALLAQRATAAKILSQRHSRTVNGTRKSRTLPSQNTTVRHLALRTMFDFLCRKVIALWAGVHTAAKDSRRQQSRQEIQRLEM